MKFSGSRRKVLALLGAAPAVPLAAKAALDQEMARLSGISIDKGISEIGAPSQSPMGSYDVPGQSAEELASEFFNLFGIPEHIRDNYERASRRIDCFDPDIAAKRSWSHSVRVITQRQRNLSRMMENTKHGIAQSRKSKAFREVAGFNWPFWY